MQSKSRHEEFLYHQLLARRIDAFFPQVLANRVNPRARQYKPYFPCYLFVNVDLSQIGVSALQWTPGAICLVCVGGEPSVVPDPLVETIERKVDEINRGGGEVLYALNRGDRVYIHNGTFEGYQGIFDARLSDRDRVRVFLDILQNKQISVDMPVADIEPLKKAPTYR